MIAHGERRAAEMVVRLVVKPMVGVGARTRVRRGIATTSAEGVVWEFTT